MLSRKNNQSDWREPRMRSSKLMKEVAHFSNPRAFDFEGIPHLLE